MIDPVVAFENEIDLLRSAVQAPSFRRCAQIADDYTRYFLINQDDNGIFVNELFQDIFGEMAQTVGNYDIPNERTTKIQEEVDSFLEKLRDAFKRNDKERLYEAMKDFRVYNTKLQFTIWHTMKLKRPHTIERIVEE